MAITLNVLRTCGLIIYLIYQVNGSENNSSDLFIQTIKVGRQFCDARQCLFSINATGSDYLGHNPWRLTAQDGAKGSSCNVLYPNYEIKEVETQKTYTQVDVSVPNNFGKIYFCLQNKEKVAPFGREWVHQGSEYYLEPKSYVAPYALNLETKSDENDTQQIAKDLTIDDTQQVTKDLEGTQQSNANWTDLSHDTDVNYLPSVSRPAREEAKDIEVFIDGTYVPLNNVLEKSVEEKKTAVYANKSNTGKPEETNRTTIKDINTSHLEELIDDKSNPGNNLPKHTVKEQNTRGIQVRIGDQYVPLNNLPRDTSFETIKLENTDIGTNDLVFSDNLKENSINVINNNNVLKSITQNYNLEAEDDTKPKIQDVDFTSINKNKDVLKSITFNDNLLNNQAKYLKIDNNFNINNDKNKEFLIKEDETNTYVQELDDFRNFGENFDVFGNGEFKRVSRQAIDDSSTVRAVRGLMIEGLRVEDSEKDPKIDDGIPSVLTDTAVTLRLYGEGLTPSTVIAFTHDEQKFGEPCKFLLKGEYMVIPGSLQFKTALFEITAPAPTTGSKLYICAKTLKPGLTDPSKDEEKYIHQGSETWKMISCHKKLLPLWTTLLLIVICLMFSALFSGLNLGLMSLDRTELKIIANTGTEQERKYARAIMPVRDHGNYLLCSILLGNVAVNSTFTILLDELTSGLFAVIFSTLAIVLLGEITPQAICSRHGLMVGARSIVVTKAIMAITAPLSFPVSKLLDYFLGEEIGNVYNRERLKELVKVTTGVNDLDKDEVNIISGALELRKKKVSEVMTKLEDAFMLPITSILDFETMSEIVKSGYSRIPVYEGNRLNIVTVLFIKDLAFVDPDDNTPLRTLCQYYENPCNFVFEDVTLDIMFKQFKEGHKGHMAFVRRINNEGEGDPFYETIGLVTLEDVIEEMIQAEIVDETDVFLDNRSKRRRNRPNHNKLQDFTAFAERHENQRIHISPQLTLATFQFLSTSVDAFRPDTVSETVLRRLLRQDVILYINMKGKTKRDQTTFVFQQGKPVDYFVLILEGRVEVTVGRENLVFEAGPFTYFGVQALTQNVGVAESPTPSAMGSLQNINMDAMLRHTFVPDYSVRAITSVYYLTVKRSLYLAAKRATLMEKGNLSKGGTNEQFDTEVDKLLQSVDEDLSITGEHKTPSRQVSPHPLPVSPAPRGSAPGTLEPRGSTPGTLEPRGSIPGTLEPRNGHAYAPTDEQELLLKK